MTTNRTAHASAVPPVGREMGPAVFFDADGALVAIVAADPDRIGLNIDGAEHFEVEAFGRGRAALLDLFSADRWWTPRRRR